MKISLTPFYDLVDKKYLSVQKHSTENLLIWNYSQRCQFERYWTEETIMARGLITDSEGNIIARPFKKFFNLEEHTGEDSKLLPLPIEEFEITEKYDGSLGIIFYYQEKWHIATRGSFSSEQAIEGQKILKELNISVLDKEYTYLFEIIY